MRLLPSIAASLLAVTLTGCFNEESVEIYTITTNAGEGGLISPPVTQAETGEVVRFYIEPDENAIINEVTGCDGTLNGNLYFTPPMSQDCEITATFLSTVVDLPDREVFPEIDATIAVAPDANYGFVPGSVRFTPTTGGAANLPAPLPEGVTPSSSLLEYQVQVENPGDTATITITYDEPIGLGHRPMKFGPAEPGAEPTWFEIPFDMFTYNPDGRSIDLTITDGGIGDLDGEVNGVIDDPFAFFQVEPEISLFLTDEFGVIGREGLYSNYNNGTTVPENPFDSFTPDHYVFLEVNDFGVDNLTIPSFWRDNVGEAFSDENLDTAFEGVGCNVSAAEYSPYFGAIDTTIVTVGIEFEGPSCIIIGNDFRKHELNAPSNSGVTFTPEQHDIHRNLKAEFVVHNESGRALKNVTGCDGGVWKPEESKYIIENVREDCTVTPVFEPYEVSASAGSNGGVAWPTSVSVNPGETASFELMPHSGYRTVEPVDSQCGGTLVRGTDTDTFTTGPVNSNCEVKASFEPINFTARVGLERELEHGSISPMSQTGIPGTRFEFTVTPDDGYEIDRFLPGTCTTDLKESIERSEVHYVYAFRGDCEFSATFKKQRVVVNTSANEGGTVTLGDTGYSSIALQHGATTQVSVNANSGFGISSVQGTECGVNYARNSNDPTESSLTLSTQPITSDCNITVEFETAVYQLTGASNDDSFGTIQPRDELVLHGQPGVFDINEIGEGYELVPSSLSASPELTCNGTLVESVYTIEEVTANCIVSADFAIKTFKVSVSQTGNGEIHNNITEQKVAPYTVDVAYGSRLQVAFIPDDGFLLGPITGCGAELYIVNGEVETYRTTPVVEDCPINVVFTQKEYQVSVSVVDSRNGSVSIVGTSPTLHGESVSFNVSPNEGLVLNAVTIPEGCGEEPTDLDANPLIIGPVTTDNCNYEFEFKYKQYDVGLTVNGEGSITSVFGDPVGETIQVQHGQTVGLFATPNEGHNLASVTTTDCGEVTQNEFTETIGLVSEPIVGDCDITINFEPNTYQISTAADNGGSWNPESASFTHGQRAIDFELTVPTGYTVNSVTGCNYESSGNIYSISGITDDCTLSATLRLIIEAPTIDEADPGDGDVTLYWESVENADSYKAYYAKESIENVENYASLDGGNVIPFPTTIGTVISTIEGLENNTEYFFKVTTVQDGFESDGSNQVSAIPVAAGAVALVLNDTGAVNCASAVSANVGCPNPSVPGQDAEHGRDADLTDNNLTKEGDGVGSLDLTKLNAGGVALTIQDQAWDVNGNEVVGTQWSCVQDNVTGLVWDSRVNDVTNYRHNENYYTWYNPTATENGGDEGIQEETSGSGPLACVDGICNAQAYVAELNANAHCGFTDWRLPTMPEMYDLFGSEHRVDTDYFPHLALQEQYKTSNTVNSLPSAGYCVSPGVSPSVMPCPKEFPGLVMPVRSGQ
ncbi:MULTISPECIES: DUF1566 domain-containing protein [Gammaproteobacteria]|uniref:Lcl C-terminal domain-containing protein n=1 Tax=Gammaproteobacteria TaxID=1236 RepID=UPI000DCF71EE|nr:MULTISPECIES: DUF1566 domain-containing protein [Gammaproteobacteria]RTE87766.1 DUF1566 domain-containing protein [Aliidiomarina sp. B3213]TCZ92452.1 DUF1566 domain-containing protein [Lysobacter sp. N42]